MYWRTLQQFSKDLESLPEQLTTLIQQGRREEAGRLMHTAKGLAATLGIKRPAGLAAEAEVALGGGAEAPRKHRS